METVQNLRQRSQAIGTLRSDDRIQVVQDGRIISVLPANPQIIYVPYYDPMVAYGTWMWPAYPPAYWRPRPGYFIQPGYSRFYWGPGITISTGFFFGAFDWHRRQVRVVHVDNYYYRRPTVNRQANVAAVGGLGHGPGVWQHNPAHRRGIAYHGPAAQRYVSAPRVQRQESRRDDPTGRLQRPETRGRSIPLTDPRSGTREGARQTTAGSTAARASEIRPEIRRAQPTTDAASPREAARASASRPETRSSQPAVRANTIPAEAVRAREIRRDLPAVPANAANSPEAPRARPWRSETRSAQSEMRRDAATRFNPPRLVAPRSEIRAGREPPVRAVTGAKTEARSAGDRGAGKPSEHRGRSGGRDGTRSSGG